MSDNQNHTGNPQSGDPQSGDILPSGAVVNPGTTGAKPEGRHPISRRGFIAGLGASAAVGLIVGGGVGGLIGHGLGQKSGAATASKNRPLSLIYGADVCDAPAIVAKEKGFFDKAGLDVQLHKSVGDEDLKAAVGSGTYDAAGGIFYSWLKPIEQGQNAKFVAGLHGGCLRLVVPSDSAITDPAQLRGKTIGIGGLQTSAAMFFSMDLLDAGINPLAEAKEVTWKVMDKSLLSDALKNHTVDAIATSDPIAYRPLQEGNGRELASNMSGANAQDYCCCAALNGDLVSKEPDLARRLVEAWAEGSRYVGGHEAEVAQIEVEKNYVAGDVATIEQLLKQYTWQPSVSKLKNALLPGIEKFKKTGYLEDDVDAQALADKALATLGLDW